MSGGETKQMIRDRRADPLGAGAKLCYFQQMAGVILVPCQKEGTVRWAHRACYR